MDAAVALPVEISEWKPAPFALGGETVFAIGDVHGCAASCACCSTPSPAWPAKQAANGG